MDVNVKKELDWHYEWLWVSGYSTLATLVLVFNLVLIVSIINNRYLHFSFHYAIIAMALRNIVRVMHSCYILGLAKLVQTHWVFKIVYQLPAETVITEDLNTFSGLPVTCHLLCTADNFLMSVAMFYVATLAIYLFCRPPHPDYPEHLKKPYVNAEQCWVPTIVTLLPPLFSCLLVLPGPFLEAYHNLAGLPHSTLCKGSWDDTVTTYNTTVPIFGYLLPLAITICVTLVLMFRRCFACGKRGGRCCSSYCKEELVLVLASCLYTVTQLAMYLPILDIYLARFDLPTTRGEIGAYLTPEIARLADNVTGLLFPWLLLSILPKYRSFASTPDFHDLSFDDEADGDKDDIDQPPHCVTRLSSNSEESFDRMSFYYK